MWTLSVQYIGFLEVIFTSALVSDDTIQRSADPKNIQDFRSYEGHVDSFWSNVKQTEEQKNTMEDNMLGV